MATIFSKIVAGEIPSYKVAEDDKFYAFLDINPLVKGHTLVVPKREEDYLFDLSDEELAAIIMCPVNGDGTTCVGVGGKSCIECSLEWLRESAEADNA